MAAETAAASLARALHVSMFAADLHTSVHCSFLQQLEMPGYQGSPPVFNAGIDSAQASPNVWLSLIAHTHVNTAYGITT
jgi:hypothetical protein